MLMMQSYIVVIQICMWWRDVCRVCMLIGNCQRVADKTLHVSIDGNTLTQVNSVRYLGVLIDSVLRHE